MSKFENKPGNGALFRNENKKSDNAPDYTGTIAGLNGEPLRIAAWLKDGKKGKFFSLKLSEDREQTKPVMDHREPAQSFKGDLDDEIPF